VQKLGAAQMTPGLSLYLDLWRVLAALQVVVFHLGKCDASGFGLGFLNALGHEAVVIFFVLSGYVISHAAKTSDLTFAHYAASRISRLYSVVIPCLLLTVVFDSIGLRLAPQVYEVVKISDNMDNPLARLFFCLLMLSESWVSIRFYSNVPFWSLCYEFWYYVLFGFYFYFVGKRRLVLLTLAALICGPRILLLLPIWLMGVAACAVPVRGTLWRGAVWLALLQPIFMAVAFLNYELGVWADQPISYLSDMLGVNFGWSKAVGSDTIIGLSFALHLAAAKQFDDRLLMVLRPLGSMIRWGAGRSFTLYLMHQPLVFLFSAVMLQFADGPWRPGLILLGTIAVPLLLAPVIEPQRHRLRPLVEWVQNRYWPRAVVLVPPVGRPG
jgi:peptidoglycan/LPS O-acetylase OafA/YrhL